MESDRLQQRWALLGLIGGAAKDRVHPVETHPLGEQLGLSKDETNRLVDELERDGYVKQFAWQAGPVTITAEGQRAVERGVGFEP